MRKYLWIAGLAVGAVVLAQSGGQALAGYVKALQDAKGLKASISSGAVSGAQSSYEISLGKPNLARLETSSELVVADGKNITTYNKPSKTYFSDPQTPASFAALFGNDTFGLFAPFFDAKALDKVPTKALGTKTRKGVLYQAVEATFNGGKKKVTFYLSPDGLARQAEIVYGDSTDSTIVLAKSLEVSGSTDASQFAFNAPAGSRELTEEERYSGKWFHNWEEGLAAATKLNKLIMVDFDATWCGPCQKMKAEVYPLPEFQAYGKQFVFLEIDVDENPGLAQKYGATAIPNVHFLKPDGTDFHQFVGYSNPQQVFGEMKAALAKAGRG